MLKYIDIFMNGRLLALTLFKDKTEVIPGVAAKTEIDYTALASSIFLKFIDVLEGALIIFAGVIAVRFVRRYFSRIETEHEHQRTALNLLEKILSGFVLVIAVTLGLKIIGLDLTLILSVLTLGLSFGLRDMIKNYVAGLLILFKSPFEIGNIVKIRNFTGRVEKIEFQSTTIRTFDRKEITIHNSDLLTQPIVNYSKTQEARLDFHIELGYGSDMGAALKIFDAILGSHPAVLKSPRYSIVFNKFDVTGVTVLVRFWVKKPCNALKIKSELALKMQETFDEQKFFAPFNREAGLTADAGMTAGRQERLKIFYGHPALAQVAAATAIQIGAAAAAQPAEEYADAEEPE